jgi:hypothetical protein
LQDAQDFGRLSPPFDGREKIARRPCCNDAERTETRAPFSIALDRP